MYHVARNMRWITDAYYMVWCAQQKKVRLDAFTQEALGYQIDVLYYSMAYRWLKKRGKPAHASLAFVRAWTEVED